MKLATVFSLIMAAGVASGFAPAPRSAVVSNLDMSTTTEASALARGERCVMSDDIIFDTRIFAN